MRRSTEMMMQGMAALAAAVLTRESGAKPTQSQTTYSSTPEPENHTVPCRQGAREMARRVRQMQKIKARGESK
jgi:hypothetical protein